MARTVERAAPRSSRGPGFTNVALMLAVLVVFALFTFAPPPNSPPAIAEVAPRALEQITDAPIEQAVSSGGQLGDIGAAIPSTTTTTAPPTAAEEEGEEEVSPFKCIGKLPRQIEDPQSPPCVPLWSGDNGGATHKGVTEDVIRVVVPDYPPFGPITALQDFFNTRFQFYGRKLELIAANDDWDTTADEATAQQQAAAKADEERHAFASLATRKFQGTTYYRELARRELIAVAEYPQYSQSMLEDLKPYVWQYGMSIDRIMSITGDWMCRRLAGSTADITTDPRLLGRQRSFGLVYADTPGNRLDIAPLRQALQACNTDFAVVRHLAPPISSQPGAPYSESSEVQAAVAELSGKGVTTVHCLCHVSILGALGIQSDRQAYYPEWTSSSYELHEVNYVQLQNNPTARQRQSMFGLSFIPRLLRASDDPAVWALQETNPSNFVTSRDDDSVHRQLIFHQLYRPLLLLASGIQLAGPRLTPETFAEGLQRTVFPNPESPLKPGRVGFQGGSFSMMQDAAEFYWSNTAPSPFTLDPPGTWCYNAGGDRFSGGDWPAGAFARSTPCLSGR